MTWCRDHNCRYNKDAMPTGYGTPVANATTEWNNTTDLSIVRVTDDSWDAYIRPTTDTSTTLLE